MQRTQEEGGKLKAGRHRRQAPAELGLVGNWSGNRDEGDPRGLAGFPHPGSHTPAQGWDLAKRRKTQPRLSSPCDSAFSHSLADLSSFPKG